MEHKNTETCADCKEREATPDCTCCQKKKERSDKEYRDLMNRLKRIEGQVRGIRQMTENGEYCIDILTQISAADSALKSVALLLLDDHLHHCVAKAAAEGGTVADEKLAEVSAAIARLAK